MEGKPDAQRWWHAPPRLSRSDLLFDQGPMREEMAQRRRPQVVISIFCMAAFGSLPWIKACIAWAPS
jgi:hypothetical protein